MAHTATRNLTHLTNRTDTRNLMEVTHTEATRTEATLTEADTPRPRLPKSSNASRTQQNIREK